MSKDTSNSVLSDDWHASLPDSDHVRVFRSRDWLTSQLGPLSTWTLELRLYTLQAFADVRPLCIWWGPSKIAVYNEAYIPLASGTHPTLMGSAFADKFPEAVAQINPLFALAEQTKKSPPAVETRLLLDRNGSLEEAIFDASFVPLMLQDGTVGGVNSSLLETTTQVLADRRRAMLNLISTPVGQLTSTTVHAYMATCLSTNKLDIPFALLYKVQREAEDGNHEIALLQTTGLSLSVLPNIKTVRLFDDSGFPPLLRSAQKAITTGPIDKDTADIDWESVEWEGHGQAPRYLTTIPLECAGRLHGFLVVGNNPRRPIDEQYHQFMADLQRYLTAAITATIGVEEAQARNQRLQDQLYESERQIRYLAQHSNIAMMQFKLDGSLIWANQHYYSVFDHQHDKEQTFIAEEYLIEEDHQHALDVWSKVVHGQRVESIELRLKQRYTPPTGASTVSTVLLSAFPYTEKGHVKSVMACMTEVSRLKWAESWQAQMANDAKDARQRQSEFTDALSHEVRNPLSAILQLADGITLSATEQERLTLEDARLRLGENTEAARTILDCARHQKRIVDDVLTLSKLDFASISLRPIAMHPQDLVREAASIFTADVTANAIDLQIIQSPSISSNVPHRVMCDTLRISQILINLLSNAIKFTKEESRRSIVVTYGATSTDPIQSFPSEVVWAARKLEEDEDLMLGAEWGNGEPVYLTFTVQDTGPGMTREQLGRVFDRFEQATPRTSIKYGGSGLGLFISHTLAEKHHGLIGATSSPGMGTTFVFYVKTFRVEDSDADEEPQTNGKTANDSKGVAKVRPSSSLKRSPPSSSESTEKASKSSKPTQHAFHLLIAEDNLINQRVLQKQLKKAGCTVYVANHGLEALDVLRTSSLWSENKGQGPQIDAILMDWEMPVMDGLACTREIRSLEQQGRIVRHAEVIAVTANVRGEQVDAAKKAGVDEVVPKPFVISELLEVISQRLKATDIA